MDTWGKGDSWEHKLLKVWDLYVCECILRQGKAWDEGGGWLPKKTERHLSVAKGKLKSACPIDKQQGPTV